MIEMVSPDMVEYLRSCGYGLQEMAATLAVSEDNLRGFMIDTIVEKMSQHYEDHGEAGDFADARRYLTQEAGEEELFTCFMKWIAT